MRHSSTRLFRYSSDVRPVLIVCLAAVTSLVPFVIHPLGPRQWAAQWGQLAAWWIVSLYVRTHAPYAQHNHGHLPVFNSKWLNRGYDVVLALVTGYPTAFWELHHNRGHHRNFLEPAKDVARIIDLETGKPMSRAWYAVRGSFTIPFDSFRIAREEAARGKPEILRKLLGELVTQLVVMGFLFWWNAPMAALFVLLPNLLASLLVWWESYVHHLDVPGDSVYSGSVTVTGERFNRVNFNIGHHTAHHEKPTLHWSLLPERTEKIADRIPAVCVRETPGGGGLSGELSPAELTTSS